MSLKLAPHLERILCAGNQAPSGENCQPWHFVVRGSVIEVHLLPERDQSAYNWGQRSSYLADGAAIENIVIAASQEGYRADVAYLPSPQDAYHVANITLIKDPSITPDPLGKAIFERVSNRKPFAKEPLAAGDKQALAALAAAPTLAEERASIDMLGRVGSTNEEVMLGNKGLHDFFFDHVTWTKEEDDEKKAGFYIKTLELPPPAQAMFKVMSAWGRMRIFKALGFTKIVAKQNGATNAAASAIGAFVVDATEPLDFIKVGRVVERFWLTVTSLGLSLQPLTGVLFFALRIKHGDVASFSPKEQEVILKAYKTAQDIFKAGGKHIAFMFRIGKGEPPTAHASRFELGDVVTVRT